mmetsp:Transcript_47718/g.144293  ORF Transcript_47718/g.144293 Transcript_47718/m.144293 type:complete len:387 (-) Transcript_47718:591-1751(-)
MNAIHEQEPLAGGSDSGQYGSLSSPLQQRGKSTGGRHRRAPSDWSAFESTATSTREEIREVTYDDRNHVSVVLQMHGSVWPHVLPFCLFNVVLTVGVFYLREAGIDITVAPVGHKFMGIVVSFLLVQAANIEYGRFMEARKHLSDCYRSCQELVQFAVILTMSDSSEGAKQWRQNIAYRTILLLRVTMACLEYQSSGEIPWDVNEMSAEDKVDMEEALMVSERGCGDHRGGGRQKTRVGKWAHGKRSMSDEAFRAPVVLAYNLRREIMSQRSGDILQMKWKHPCNEEIRISDYVMHFMTAFHGLKKLTTTPLPFPLVQMARTFTFFWVFTLPFALCHKAVFLIQLCFTVFFITYGFLGLMYVTMDLQDPFGDDPTDFDDLGMAQVS